MRRTEQCGCTFLKHQCGAFYRELRCNHHTSRWPIQNVFEEKEYRRMGVLESSTNHVSEFINYLGEIEHKESGSLIEYGAGVSPYVQMILDAGYSYHAVDTSQWAAEYMRARYKIQFTVSTVDDFSPERQVDVVLAAHVLEHVPDAVASVSKFAQSLVDNGVLYLIIPDDTDFGNQDHLWFFTPKSAIDLLRPAGFLVESIFVAKIVSHENFMYIRARKVSK